MIVSIILALSAHPLALAPTAAAVSQSTSRIQVSAAQLIDTYIAPLNPDQKCKVWKKTNPKMYKKYCK